MCHLIAHEWFNLSVPPFAMLFGKWFSPVVIWYHVFVRITMQINSNKLKVTPGVAGIDSYSKDAYLFRQFQSLRESQISSHLVHSNKASSNNSIYAVFIFENINNSMHVCTIRNKFRSRVMVKHVLKMICKRRTNSVYR